MAAALAAPGRLPAQMRSGGAGHHHHRQRLPQPRNFGFRFRFCFTYFLLIIARYCRRCKSA